MYDMYKKEVLKDKQTGQSKENSKNDKTNTVSASVVSLWIGHGA